MHPQVGAVLAPCNGRRTDGQVDGIEEYTSHQEQHLYSIRNCLAICMLCFYFKISVKQSCFHLSRPRSRQMLSEVECLGLLSDIFLRLF